MKRRAISINKLLPISIIAILVGKYLNYFPTSSINTILILIVLILFGITLLAIFKYKQPFSIYSFFAFFGLGALFMLLDIMAEPSTMAFSKYQNYYTIFSGVSLALGLFFGLKYAYKNGNSEIKRAVRNTIIIFSIVAVFAIALFINIIITK